MERWDWGGEGEETRKQIGLLGDHDGEIGLVGDHDGEWEMVIVMSVGSRTGAEKDWAGRGKALWGGMGWGRARQGEAGRGRADGSDGGIRRLDK